MVLLERSHLFDVAGGDVFGRVGVAGDVALRAVAEASFEFVGVGVGGLGELERERVAEVVGSEWAYLTFRVRVFSVVETADAFEDRVDTASGEPPVGRRLLTDTADRNNAVESASAGRSTSR